MRRSARSSTRALTIEGYSRAAVQTYWRVPELKLGFDLGAQPWSFMATPTWFVTHAHLDHVAALPVLVARRRMMKMEPPTIYLPAEAVEGVEALLRTSSGSIGAGCRHLDRARSPATKSSCPASWSSRRSPPSTRSPRWDSLVWERRKKLKPEYQDLTGDQIRDLRLSGVEVSAEIRLPKVAYLGDTAPPGLDAFAEIYQAQILILEMTFVAPNERPSVIHKFGHTHLDDLLARADRFENEVIIASHFSTRLHPDQIQRIVEKSLPDSLQGRLKVWL